MSNTQLLSFILDLWEAVKWIFYAMFAIVIAISAYQLAFGPPQLDSLKRTTGTVTRLRFQSSNPQVLVGLNDATVKESFWHKTWPSQPSAELKTLSYGDDVTAWHLKDGAYERLWQLERGGQLLLSYDSKKALWKRDALKLFSISIAGIVVLFLYTRAFRWWVSWHQRACAENPNPVSLIVPILGSLVFVAGGVWMIGGGDTKGWYVVIVFSVFALIGITRLATRLIRAP